MAPLVLILDFDGVIVESNNVKTEVFQDVFREWPEHFDAMMAYHHEHVSVTRFEKFKYLQERLGLQSDDSFIPRVAGEFSRRMLDRMRTIPEVTGAADFIHTFSARLPVYLASVTPEEELHAILDMRGYARWLRGVYGCPPWNKPDAIRDILRLEQIPAERVLFIGDSAGDQRAAEILGVPFAARNSGLPFDKTPEHMFADMNEAAAYLEKLL
jgi:phosphoglycolate phosphatase-like HAD superfamily hydrolase